MLWEYGQMEVFGYGEKFCMVSQPGISPGDFSNHTPIQVGVTDDGVTGDWVNEGGTWFFRSPDGTNAVGWVNDGGVWYYMHPSGAMATGWVLIGGVWNWFYDCGAWWGTY